MLHAASASVSASAAHGAAADTARRLPADGAPAAVDTRLLPPVRPTGSERHLTRPIANAAAFFYCFASAAFYLTGVTAQQDGHRIVRPDTGFPWVSTGFGACLVLFAFLLIVFYVFCTLSSACIGFCVSFERVATANCSPWIFHCNTRRSPYFYGAPPNLNLIDYCWLLRQVIVFGLHGFSPFNRINILYRFTVRFLELVLIGSVDFRLYCSIELIYTDPYRFKDTE